MNDIHLIKNNPMFGTIRIEGTEKEPLFCASDVCKALGYAKPQNAVAAHVDAEDALKRSTPTEGGRQEMTFVTESGLYALIFGSKLPQAKEFKKWVTSEVLPSIRQNGGYMLIGDDEAEEDLMARALIVAKATLKRREERIKALESESQAKDKEIVELSGTISEMKPKVNYVDTILSCKETVTTTQIAQDYGQSAKAFNVLLRNFGIQHKVGGQWILYAKYLPCGYVQSETVSITHRDGSAGLVMHTKWTQKGRLFLYDELKNHDIIPTIEQRKAENE